MKNKIKILFILSLLLTWYSIHVINKPYENTWEEAISPNNRYVNPLELLIRLVQLEHSFNKELFWQVYTISSIEGYSWIAIPALNQGIRHLSSDKIFPYILYHGIEHSFNTKEKAFLLGYPIKKNNNYLSFYKKYMNLYGVLYEYSPDLKDTENAKIFNSIYDPALLDKDTWLYRPSLTDKSTWQPLLDFTPVPPNKEDLMKED